MMRGNTAGLRTAMKALEGKEPYYKQVIEKALYEARYRCGEHNPKAILGDGNAYLTSVEYDTDLDAPVAILRDFEKGGKLAVVAAYQIEVIGYCYSFTEVTADVFARLASKDNLVALTNAPKELADYLKSGSGEEDDRATMKILLDGKRNEVALNSFRAALNEVNIALMGYGYQPFRDWRDFYAAAVEGGFDVGCGFAMGVSWQEYSILTGRSEPEIRELRALFDYRDDGSEIKSA